MEKGDKRAEQTQESAGWQYKASGADSDGDMSVPAMDADPARAAVRQDVEEVEWTASEFVAHEKGFAWYAIFVLSVAAVAAVIYLITHDVFSAVAIFAIAVVLVIAAARKPRVQTYRLDANGVKVGEKHHYYTEYKSFALTEQQPFTGIVLIPMKRFGLPLNIYLAPDNEHQVLDVLSSHLPLERGGLDGFEKLMRQVRF